MLFQFQPIAPLNLLIPANIAVNPTRFLYQMSSTQYSESSICCLTSVYELKRLCFIINMTDAPFFRFVNTCLRTSLQRRDGTSRFDTTLCHITLHLISSIQDCYLESANNLKSCDCWNFRKFFSWFYDNVIQTRKPNESFLHPIWKYLMKRLLAPERPVNLTMAEWKSFFIA